MNNISFIKKCVVGFVLAAILLFPHESTAQSTPDDASKVTPLLIGATIPDVSVKDASGENIRLFDLVAQKPTVLIFYRGGWCPYCNKHMAELQQIEKDLVDEGYQVVAISPDRPDKLNESVNRHSLDYTLLSDSPMTATKAFGVAYKVDGQTVARYKQNGLDLEGDSGYKHHLLPVPSVFIIDTKGKILFEYVNPDYKERISSDVLITAARSYNQK